MKCIHQPNRLSVIPSELAPLLDVVPIGVEVQADEVFNQPDALMPFPPRKRTTLSSSSRTVSLTKQRGLAVDKFRGLSGRWARYSSNDNLRCLLLTRFCGIARFLDRLT